MALSWMLKRRWGRFSHSLTQTEKELVIGIHKDGFSHNIFFWEAGDAVYCNKDPPFTEFMPTCFLMMDRLIEIHTSFTF